MISRFFTGTRCRFAFARARWHNADRALRDLCLKRGLDPIDDLLHFTHLLLPVEFQENLDIHVAPGSPSTRTPCSAS